MLRRRHPEKDLRSEESSAAGQSAVEHMLSSPTAVAVARQATTTIDVHTSLG